jgi:predicted peptidase
MRIILPLVLLLLASVDLKAQDLNLYSKEIYTSPSGDQLPYRILYPKNYDQSKKYPLVLLLHGGGERGNDNEKQLTHGAKLFLTDENRENFPAIVIVPQCSTDSYWASVTLDRSTSPITLGFDYSRPITNPLKNAIELVQKISNEQGVDKKRIYITGLSMGGMGTFEAVYRYPKLFAAAATICGGGDTIRYDNRVKKIPFRVFHGDADVVISVNESRQMVKKLQSLNVSVNYKEYPGVNHNSWDNAFAEPDFLSWMFSKKK